MDFYPFICIKSTCIPNSYISNTKISVSFNSSQIRRKSCTTRRCKRDIIAYITGLYDTFSHGDHPHSYNHSACLISQTASDLLSEISEVDSLSQSRPPSLNCIHVHMVGGVEPSPVCALWNMFLIVIKPSFTQPLPLRVQA